MNDPLTIQNDALNDYPDDRALLARKAQKAAKEVAAKQASGQQQGNLISLYFN